MEVSSKIVMKKIGEIKPYIRNPRKNDKTVDVLVKIIPKVGFNVPLVIDKKGVIVKGHSRFKAAIKLGMEEIPCIITEADEEAIKLDRIADNRVSEFSEWLSEGLAHELDMITLDIGDLEFDMPTFDDMPSFDDEVFGDGEQGDGGVDEDKMKRYQELLAKQEAESQAKTQITTQKALDKAQEKLKEPPRQDKYYKFVCEHCGHIMFVKAEDVWDANSGK
jgi:site-specific DNA-methyltransferase (adenine-specific)